MTASTWAVFIGDILMLKVYFKITKITRITKEGLQRSKDSKGRITRKQI